MKQALFIAFCCLLLKTSAQEVNNEFDGKKWEAPYFLEMPKGWDIERFMIPISFAPSIPYKGMEDIRFTPGWSKKGSADYWSYAFLWYLDGIQKFDSEIIETNLTAYYTGLLAVNTGKSKVDSSKFVPVRVVIKKQISEQRDNEIFEGFVDMPDYMTLQPIRLNLSIHTRYCKEQDKTFVFHEVSPQPYSNSIWKSLHQLWINFRCTKE